MYLLRQGSSTKILISLLNNEYNAEMKYTLLYSAVHWTTWYAEWTSLRHCAIKGRYLKEDGHSGFCLNWPTLRLAMRHHYLLKWGAAGIDEDCPAHTGMCGRLRQGERRYACVQIQGKTKTKFHVEYLLVWLMRESSAESIHCQDKF